jgi:hypothetical protein
MTCISASGYEVDLGTHFSAVEMLCAIDITYSLISLTAEANCVLLPRQEYLDVREMK